MRSVGGFARMIASLLREAYAEWQRDGALDLGAALAYYTSFSLAPLFVIVIAIAGLAFGAEAARGEIFAQLRGLIGVNGAEAIETAVASASRPTSGILATLVGFGALLLGASGVFAQLQGSLNRIWSITPPRGGWRAMLQNRVTSFAMVVGIGFLLLVSLVVNAGLAALGHWLGGRMSGMLLLLNVANALISYAGITVLFAMMFKMLPDAQIAWRDVWIGAAITSLLFTIGKSLISLYVGQTAVGSAYGVAGSILVILAWIYYSSQIFFFGAECTQVYANLYGSHIRVRPARPSWSRRGDRRPLPEAGPPGDDAPA